MELNWKHHLQERLSDDEVCSESLYLSEWDLKRETTQSRSVTLHDGEGTIMLSVSCCASLPPFHNIFQGHLVSFRVFNSSSYISELLWQGRFSLKLCHSSFYKILLLNLLIHIYEASCCDMLSRLLALVTKAKVIQLILKAFSTENESFCSRELFSNLKSLVFYRKGENQSVKL